MDIYRLISQAKDAGWSTLAQATGVLGGGVGYVRSALAQTWLFGSTESSNQYDRKVDEKHYFLIPDPRNLEGFSLYTMRCLPDGVPPINDLPKQRFFHLPNADALPTIESLLLDDARQNVQAKSADGLTLGSRLNGLADQIDKLDNKLFNGVLLVGGLVALVNPMAGAAIALKALMPSMGLLLSKFGLKYAGETLTTRDVASRVKAAEKDVLKQFQGVGTKSLVNPLLGQLEKAFSTTEWEYDPLMEFDVEQLDFESLDRQRLFRLSCLAIANTFEASILKESELQAVGMGDEDIRFLRVICELAKQAKTQ